jgi:alpha-1,3-glucosyltransferase
MHGDFEAQRHWMEITYHLPTSQWYFYDLPYWGLDYPPLTAYVSWMCGAVANAIDKDWVALDYSRGIEGYGVKLFMRASALASDLAVYLPAIYLFTKLSTNSWNQQQNLFSLIWLQPALILIDHGHFQYNCIMLGLAAGAFTCFSRRRYLIGSMLFVLSLMFKQMALYYSLPVFVFLLSTCFRQRTVKDGLALLIKIGATVLATTAICLIPFLDLEQLKQIAHRVFPVARGLYEDKVANVWCALSVVVKLKDVFEQGTLAVLRCVDPRGGLVRG